MFFSILVKYITLLIINLFSFNLETKPFVGKLFAALKDHSYIPPALPNSEVCIQ